MNNLSPALANHLNCFNGTIESLRPFFKAVHRELKIKNETLEHNENRVAKLLEQASNGIVLLNSDGVITYVTPAVLKTFGYTEKELLNTSNLRLGHPDEKSILRDFLESIMNEPGKTGEITYRVKTKAGTWRWVKSHVTNMLHEKGVNSIVFNYEDITENVLLQQARDFEKSNTEALINSTSDLMWSVDKEFKLITANKPFLERIKHQYGVCLNSGDVLINPNWVNKAKSDKWEERYQQALSGASFKVNDFFDVQENNRWEETTFYPIYEKNEIKGISCFLRDITEKKNSYETIKKNETLLATAQSIANFGSWEFVAENGEITESALQWSDQLYRITGHHPDKFKPTLKKLLSIIHPDDVTFMRDSLQFALLNNSLYDIEYRIIKPNGDIAWIRSVGKVVHSENNVSQKKMIGTAQDITSKKIIEEERTQLINDLLQANKDHEQFAYVISHNLRGPVATIQGLTEIFKNYIKNDSIEYTCATGIYQSAVKLDEVIRDMHYILQVKKDFSEKKSDVDLGRLVDDVTESIQSYIQKQDGRITTCFKKYPQLYTLRGYLYSIVYNLLTNSLKYRRTDVSPVININSDISGDKCILIFRDNGMGIDLERYKTKLFTLYQRLHMDIEGKGIGLYMVKSQVEALGGSIEVSSEVNKGTEFIITLPVKNKQHC